MHLHPWRLIVAGVSLLGLALVLGLTVLARGARDARWPPPDWLVLACDVGQGDGLLIRSPGAAHALLVDRVGVAGALRPVVAADAHDRGLLADERLDRVRARHLRRQVDLQHFHAPDLRHPGASRHG